MVNGGKKSLGRRKIEMKKIEKKSSLQVTFSKRRSGLFRKAGELAVLCGAQVAVLVQSPAGKIYTFSHPSVDSVIGRFQTGGDAPPPAVWDDGRSEYEEAVRRLEIEKTRMVENDFWWDDACENMELHELEEYLQALENLRNNVSYKLMKLQGDF